jgi:hypothetical protein
MQETLLPTYLAAKRLGVAIHFFYRAVKSGALPADAVIRTGRRRYLIDVSRRDEIIRALAVWSQQAAKPDNDREARIRRIVGGEG